MMNFSVEKIDKVFCYLTIQSGTTSYRFYTRTNRVHHIIKNVVDNDSIIFDELQKIRQVLEAATVVGEPDATKSADKKSDN